VLFQAGEASDELFVVLEGEAEVVRLDAVDDAPVAAFGPGGSIGELTLLTGRLLRGHRPGGRVCAGAPVLVVGGGNSAGQAAIYLAQNDCGVAIAIRRDDLRHGMSEYLVERIEANPSPAAAAAGEGSSAVRSVHERLATQV
jgi:CRP-like cAMP-binding protein